MGAEKRCSYILLLLGVLSLTSWARRWTESNDQFQHFELSYCFCGLNIFLIIYLYYLFATITIYIHTTKTKDVVLYASVKALKQNVTLVTIYLLKMIP